MKTIKVKAPAKINLTLKVFQNPKNGFHDIESVMQAIDIFDIITISITSVHNEILLDGTLKDELEYNEKNIAHRATKLFLDKTKIKTGVEIFIEKNIPLSGGLGGSSADGAGVLWGLNKIFDYPLNEVEILNLCSMLGSDVNFCFLGGKKLAKGKGDILSELKFEPFKLTIVKPQKIGVSAGFAYQKFDELKTQSTLQNDLEFALLPYFEEFRYLHNLGFSMSGSGSAFFKFGDCGEVFNLDKFLVIKNVKAINHGVCEA